jgi:hypothetical protein
MFVYDVILIFFVTMQDIHKPKKNFFKKNSLYIFVILMKEK